MSSCNLLISPSNLMITGNITYNKYVCCYQLQITSTGVLTIEDGGVVNCNHCIINGTIHIKKGGTLLVRGSNGIVNNGTVSNLVIAWGANILIHPDIIGEKAHPKGTCSLETRIRFLGENAVPYTYAWQNIAYPTQQSGFSYEPKGILAVNLWTSSGWVSVNSASQLSVPFNAYHMTVHQDFKNNVSKPTMNYSGNLVLNTSPTITTHSSYSNFIGNSWLAPIDVSVLCKKFNVQSIYNFTNGYNNLDSDTFTYYSDGLLAPMCGFFVDTDFNKNVKLDYLDLVWNPWWHRFKYDSPDLYESTINTIKLTDESFDEKLFESKITGEPI